MQTIRAILAATDFSPPAVQASRRAARLAAQLGAGLTLFHVVPPDPVLALRDRIDGRDLDAALLEQARIELAAHAQQLQQEAGIAVQERLAQGSCLKETLAAAADADLLVLGARGARALRDFTIGSTADRLLRSATCPMLVVKQPPDHPYRNGLVLTDFSPASEIALATALALAPDTRLRLLHAYDLPSEGRLRLAGVSDAAIQEYRDRARAEALRQLGEAAGAASDGRVLTEAVQGDPYVEMLQHVETLQPDLIAVGKQGRSALQDFFLGSTTAHVLAEARCDVLVVPGGARA